MTPLKISYDLESSKPKSLLKDKRGVLFYTNDTAKLKFIEYDYDLLGKSATQGLQPVNLRPSQNFKEYSQHMMGNLGKSLKYFGKNVINYGKTFFTKDPYKTLIEYDS